MYDQCGKRKYVNMEERNEIRRAISKLQKNKSVFCEIILETGCRISEAINLRACQIDISSKYIRFESLKKRRRGVYRSVPISDLLTKNLKSLFNLNEIRSNPERRLWLWSRVTAYRLIKNVMAQANIYGSHANPRGLRHGFAIAALESGVPITLVQRWLGHASLKTTAIYTQVVGEEERRLAARMWRRTRDAAMPSIAKKNSLKQQSSLMYNGS